MTLMSGWSGLDFGSLDPDMKIEYVETNAMRTMLQGFAEADPEKEWTVRDVAKYAGIGGAGPHADSAAPGADGADRSVGCDRGHCRGGGLHSSRPDVYAAHTPCRLPYA